MLARPGARPCGLAEARLREVEGQGGQAGAAGVGTQMDEPRDAIATRTLQILDDVGQPVDKITVAIGRPRPDAALPDDWCCPGRVRTPGAEKHFRSMGVDAVQALGGAILAAG